MQQAVIISNRIVVLVLNTPLNVGKMTTAQWYRVLLEKNIKMEDNNNSPNQYIRFKAEE